MKISLFSFILIVLSVVNHSPVFGFNSIEKELIIGATVGDFSDMVKESIRPQLERQGFKVKLVEFTDYRTPNLALAEGSLDVNVFQHKPYLEEFCKEHRLALVAVTEVPTAPLGL